MVNRLIRDIVFHSRRMYVNESERTFKNELKLSNGKSKDTRGFLSRCSSYEKELNFLEKFSILLKSKDTNNLAQLKYTSKR